MELVFLLLAILSLIIAIMSFPWLKEPLEQSYRKLKDKYIVVRSREKLLASVESIRKGTQTSTTDDFFIFEWKHLIKLDDEGKSSTEIDCLLVNNLNYDQDHFEFPAYFENPPENFEFWYKIGKAQTQLLKPRISDSMGDSRIYRIPFIRPLLPRQLIRIHFGYGRYGSYFEGEHWWEWYIARPHSDFQLTLSFADSFKVVRAVGKVIPEDILQAQPEIIGNRLNWRIKAPILGRKYRLDYKLAKSI